MANPNEEKIEDSIEIGAVTINGCLHPDDPDSCAAQMSIHLGQGLQKINEGMMIVQCQLCGIQRHVNIRDGKAVTLKDADAADKAARGEG